MPDNELSAKLGLDSTDFKTQISTLNRELRVMESGFRASAASMGDWANNANGLEMRIGNLTGQMEAQQKKVAALQSEYERIAQTEGMESRAAEGMRIRLNDATAALGRMKAELNDTAVRLAQMGSTSKLVEAEIASLGKDIALSESGFKAATASMQDWRKSSEGLTLRLKSLNNQIGNQKLVVANVAEEYKKAAAEKGEFSDAAKDLQIRLNRETETLGKMVGEVRQTKTALDGMGDESKQASHALSDLGDKEDKTAKKSMTLKDAMGGLGSGLKTMTKVVAGTVAAVAGLGVAITGMVFKASDVSGELVDLSTQTGISVEKLQEMKFVGDLVGVSVETMTGSLAKLTKSMGDAKDGSGTAFDAFGKLGISVVDANGNLRDSEAVFGDALSALGDMANETERDALAMEIFGRSAMELNPLIKAGADEVARLTDEAHEMGAVMKKEDVMALESFGDVLASLQLSMQGMMGTLAAAFLPGFQGIAGIAKDYMKQLAGILSGSDGDLGTMAEGIGGLIGKIVNDIAGKLPDLMNAGLGILKGIMNAVMANLTVMIPAILQILTSVAQFIIQNIPLLIPAVVQIMNDLVRFITQNMTPLFDGAVKMLAALAYGITKAIPQLVPAIVDVIMQIVKVLVENLPLLVDAALQIIIALSVGLVAAIPVLLAVIPGIMNSLVKAFQELWPMIIEAGRGLINQVVQGITNAWPKMKESGSEIGNIWINGVRENLTTFLSMGGEIVTALWNGIKEKATWLYDQIKGFFTGLIGAANDALDRHSPPGKFLDMGSDMANALGLGWMGAFGQIERDIKNTIGALSGPSPSIAVEGVGSGGRGSGPAPVVVNINNPKINNELDIHRLAYQVSNEILRHRQ